jgi:hypothetical protein
MIQFTYCRARAGNDVGPTYVLEEVSRSSNLVPFALLSSTVSNLEST